MKILIISQYFYPENFKVNDIAFDFQKDGHDVTVLTGKPNYPNGRFFKGYSFFGKREEIIEGVKIIRIPIFPRGKGKGLSLALNYLSFLFFSWFAVHFRIKKGTFDTILTHSPSPLTSALPGVWLKKKIKKPLSVWVLDLWPESVIANSRIKGGVVIKVLDKIIKYLYSNTDNILISSSSFKKNIIQRFGVDETKVVYFPNWAESIFDAQESNITKVNQDLPAGFNIMFAGNIGESQDFDSILRTAELCKDQPINWIILGSGRKEKWVMDQIKNRKLNKMFLLGRRPLEQMPAYFKQADALLVTLKNEKAFELTVPAKTQAYMASGKILLGMINGETKELINKNNIGFAVEAGDYQSLADIAKSLLLIDKKDLNQMGANSKTYYQNHFSKAKLFPLLKNILCKDIQSNPADDN